MSEHRIRLHGPWQQLTIPLAPALEPDALEQTLAGTWELPAMRCGDRLRLPGPLHAIPETNEVSGVILIRPFRQPTGLNEPGEHRSVTIRLEVLEPAGLVSVWLNGRRLDGQAAAQAWTSFDLRTHLEPQNRLALLIRSELLRTPFTECRLAILPE